MSKVIEEWRPQSVIDFARALVEQRLETAAKLVETEACRNLADISDPEWGAGYRNEVVGRLLTSFVEKGNKELLAHIGVRMAAGKGGDSHGFYIETGSSTAPQHPWLRPALFENLSDIKAILEG